MRKIRKHRCLFGLWMVIVLLSFFSSAALGPDLKADRNLQSSFADSGGKAILMDEGVEGRLTSPAMIDAGDCRLPEGTGRISLARALLNDIVTREQNVTRTLLMRFWAAVFVAAFIVWVAYRAIIRRFGSHMIALWQNIYYIHQVDGKKGKRFSGYIG